MSDGTAKEWRRGLYLISCDNGLQPVDALLDPSGQLLVHERRMHEGMLWALTHAATGLSLGFDHEQLPVAMAMAEVLGEVFGWGDGTETPNIPKTSLFHDIMHSHDAVKIIDPPIQRTPARPQ